MARRPTERNLPRLDTNRGEGRATSSTRTSRRTISSSTRAHWRPGMCDIPNTILKKIKRCDIFLCDLTFVGSYTNRASTTKKVSNPNVYFEFGFAVARLGLRRVISVMNAAYGSANQYSILSDAGHDGIICRRCRRCRRRIRPVEAHREDCRRLAALLEKSPSRKRILTELNKFQQIRESFESAVIGEISRTHCRQSGACGMYLVPDRFHRLNRNAIRHSTPAHTRGPRLRVEYRSSHGDFAYRGPSVENRPRRQFAGVIRASNHAGDQGRRTGPTRPPSAWRGARRTPNPRRPLAGHVDLFAT